MTDTPSEKTRKIKPQISFVMPCYNEEEMIGYTIPHLANAFENAGYNLELIAVDNGSVDRTGELIQELAVKHTAVVYHRVDVNEGYGNGVLCGLKVATAPYIGIIPADGQVDAEDVVRLYEAIAATNGNVIAKVRRRFRMDGLTRKIVSVGFNVFVNILWPRLGSYDVNGSPKIIPRDVLTQLDLKSKNWFLDAEMIIKSHYMGVRILEFNVFGRLRGNGLSHVNVNTVGEFFWKLLQYRFSPDLGNWKRELEQTNFKTETSAG
ncbi:MAG: glycosyltransferase family 2 protein [Chloroflexi bacterium]|nr:glycosyltransferase family 2 protein [Chloroflexota bacterium]